MCGHDQASLDDQRLSMRWRIALGLLLLANLALLLGFISTDSTSANTDSRLATIECLAHYGTFHIDRSRYVGTIDKVRLDGHFISTKPPLISAAAALAYRVRAELTGRTFANDEEGSIRLVSVVTGVAPYMIMLFYFLAALAATVRRPPAMVLGLLAITIGNIGMGYATGISNHVPAALAVMGAFYHGLRARRSGTAAHHWMLAGLWTGLIAVFDIALAPVAVVFLVCLVAVDWRRALGLAVPCFAVPLASHLVLSHAITGSFMPVYGRRELYDYPGSFWKPLLDAGGKASPELLRQMGLEGARDPKLLYFFHLLLGHHGFFAMTPLLALGLWQAVRCVRERCVLSREALAVLAGAALTLLLIVIRSRNYGGVCVGLRWMVGVMPLFFLFAAIWLDRRFSRGAALLFLLLALAGSFSAGDALEEPWKRSAWERLLRGAAVDAGPAAGGLR